MEWFEVLSYDPRDPGRDEESTIWKFRTLQEACGAAGRLEQAGMLRKPPYKKGIDDNFFDDLDDVIDHINYLDRKETRLNYGKYSHENEGETE